MTNNTAYKYSYLFEGYKTFLAPFAAVDATESTTRTPLCNQHPPPHQLMAGPTHHQQDHQEEHRHLTVLGHSISQTQAPNHEWQLPCTPKATLELPSVHHQHVAYPHTTRGSGR